MTGSVDDHPPLQPCNWSHADRHVLVRGVGSRFGNWCAPPDEWTMPDSLKPGARCESPNTPRLPHVSPSTPEVDGVLGQASAGGCAAVRDRRAGERRCGSDFGSQGRQGRGPELRAAGREPHGPRRVDAHYAGAPTSPWGSAGYGVPGRGTRASSRESNLAARRARPRRQPRARPRVRET